MTGNEDFSWHPILRSILDHWVWKDKPFSKGQAWVDMILLAQCQPQKRLVQGQLVALEKGDLCWPIYLLAERWGWSRNKVFRFFDALETDLMVEVKTIQRITITKLLNYKTLHEMALGEKTINDTAEGQPKDNRRYPIQEEEEEKSKKNTKTPRLSARAQAEVEMAKANPLWDSLVLEFRLKPVTRKEQIELGRIVADYREKGCAPEDVAVRAGRYRRFWPGIDCNPRALLKHWDKFEEDQHGTHQKHSRQPSARERTDSRIASLLGGDGGPAADPLAGSGKGLRLSPAGAASGRDTESGGAAGHG